MQNLHNKAVVIVAAIVLPVFWLWLANSDVFAVAPSKPDVVVIDGEIKFSVRGYKVSLREETGGVTSIKIYKDMWPNPEPVLSRKDFLLLMLEVASKLSSIEKDGMGNN